MKYKFMMRLAGKSNFDIDEKVGLTYIFRLAIQYGIMMIRGKRRSLFYSGISNKVFIGKRVKLYCKNQMCIGDKTKIKNFCKIDALSKDGVNIGKNCVIGENSRIECTGTIRNIGKGFSMGDNSTFGSDCYFGSAGGIEIGNNVIAGQYIRFHSENHVFDDLNELIKDQGVTYLGIKVGNNCWIGAGAVFLDGAEIGDGCVVAANAVVTNKFPENAVIGGVPAKIIKIRV